MNQVRCQSTFCVVNADQTRGRLFTIPENAEGITKIWCPSCLQISRQITFFSSQTADMIRQVYREYVQTNLPKEVILILEQFTREIIQQLGDEL